jgi:hypothetical protein
MRLRSTASKPVRCQNRIDRWLAGAAFCAEAAELFTMPSGR